MITRAFILMQLFFLPIAKAQANGLKIVSINQLQDTIKDSLSTKRASKPNIVYILADDLGYGDVQSLNPDGKIKTPQLDKLAAEGMRFSDAHSGSSVCTPTRYGILTGRYAWRTRLQKGVLSGKSEPDLIAKDRLTVAALLKKNGYKTACIGKWHLGYLIESANSPSQEMTNVSANDIPPPGSVIKDGPTAHGFDYFIGCSNARQGAAVIENDKVIDILKDEERLPKYTQSAVEYIHDNADEARAGKPFFLYFALTAPHTPIAPSKEWKGKSGISDYADFVMQSDAAVGEIMTALDRAGLTDNTLVVFTSDNGCSPEAKTQHLESVGHFASGPFRGYKSDIWDGGHRVPFFVKWPDKVQGNSACSRTICLVDFMATCAELTGTKLPDNAAEDSESILKDLTKKNFQPRREAIVHHSIQGKFSIRQGKWKLCLTDGSGGWSKDKTVSPQLYDLENDISERNNLAAANPKLVKKLTTLLEQFVANGRSTPGRKQKNDVEVDIYKEGKAN